jgi:hypothetical protein
MKKVFSGAKEPIPIPIEKCNKKWWDSFFHISLGLNSLPGSCVTHVTWQMLVIFPYFSQNPYSGTLTRTRELRPVLGNLYVL